MIQLLKGVLWTRMETLPPGNDKTLAYQAIRALRWIILSSIFGIIVLSVWGAALRYGVFQETPVDVSNSSADEALSILGNVASAAVGGLVGWLTRDLVVRTPTGNEESEEIAG